VGCHSLAFAIELFCQNCCLFLLFCTLVLSVGFSVGMWLGWSMVAGQAFVCSFTVRRVVSCVTVGGMLGVSLVSSARWQSLYFLFHFVCLSCGPVGFCLSCS